MLHPRAPAPPLTTHACCRICAQAALLPFNLVQVVTTSRSVAVRASDGLVLVWGEGSSGELGLGPRRTATTRPTPLPNLLASALAAGQHTLCAITPAHQLCVTGSLCMGTGRSLGLTALPPLSRPHPLSASSPGLAGFGAGGASGQAFAFPPLPAAPVAAAPSGAGALVGYAWRLGVLGAVR